MGETPKDEELETEVDVPAGESVEGAEAKFDKRFLVVLAILLVVAGAYHMWREQEHQARLSSSNLRTTKIEKREVEEEPEPEPEPEEHKEEESKPEEQAEPGLTEDDIESIISERLAYQGESLRVDKEAITIGIRDGRVVVYHDLASETNVDYRVLAKRAGQRANALAAELTGKRVGGDDSKDFSDLTWVVRSPSGNVYVATCEGPGEQRVTDKTYGVLASSKGYVLASKVLAVLGPDSGLSAAAGEHPKDLDGTEIMVDGTTENNSEQVTRDSDSGQVTGATTYREEETYSQTEQTDSSDTNEATGSQSTTTSSNSEPAQSNEDGADSNEAPTAEAGGQAEASAGNETQNAPAESDSGVSQQDAQPNEAPANDAPAADAQPQSDGEAKGD